MLIILPKLLSTQKWVAGAVWWGVGKRPGNGGRGEEGRRGRGAREEKQEERKEGSKKWNMEKEELQEGNGVNRMVE